MKAFSARRTQFRPSLIQQVNYSGQQGQKEQPPSYGLGFVDRQAQPIQQKALNRTGLPDTLKAGIEYLSGYTMDDVKVHYNSAKPAQFQALAYAQGTDIHIAPGQERHLPHEAWHVVQQMEGRVQPTRQLNGGVQVNDDEGLEREATEMGHKSAQIPIGSSNLQLNKIGGMGDHHTTNAWQSSKINNTLQRVHPRSLAIAAALQGFIDTHTSDSIAANVQQAFTDLQQVLTPLGIIYQQRAQSKAANQGVNGLHIGEILDMLNTLAKYQGADFKKGKFWEKLTKMCDVLRTDPESDSDTDTE